MRVAVLIALFSFVAVPAFAQTDNDGDFGCPAQYTYQQCVDNGYYNHWGSGQTGSGGTGGYCQNQKKSVLTSYVWCSDGQQYPCPKNQCWNSPGSNT